MSKHPSDISIGFFTVLDELVQRPRADVGTVAPSAAVVLGNGQTSDVWGIENQALKLYRLRTGLPVIGYMTAEIETYRLLASISDNGLPEFYGSGEIVHNGMDAQACGWALFALVKGHPLGYAELAALEPKVMERWVHDVAFEAAKMEACLAKVAAQQAVPEAWNHNYADTRIPRLIDWERNSPEKGVAASDVALAEKLGELIIAEQKTSSIIYIHGDFNPPNIVTDLSDTGKAGSIARFVDPLIALEPTEANWRHQTFLPELADGLAAQYDKTMGHYTNHRLMYAIGALTHLYIAIAIPEQGPIRRQALQRCLTKIGLNS